VIALRLLCLMIAVLLAPPAIAELCGDADGSAAVTVTDGVNSLRAAAGLPGPCTADSRRCDVDGDGAVSVTDGVAVLRVAAGLTLSIAVPCPRLQGPVPTPISTANGAVAEIFGVMTKVRSVAGVEARLVRGAAPLPPAGAPRTITGLEAQFQGFDAARVVVPFDGGAVASGAGDDALILAVARGDGSLMEGFYELPLGSGVSQELLDLTFASTTVVPLVRLATRLAGVVSRYETTLVSFAFSSDTPLFGFDVRARYPVETGAFVGAADKVSCRIPAFGLGLQDQICAEGDDVGFVANNKVDEGELVLIVVSCLNQEAQFVSFPIEIVCAFAAAPGHTLAPAADIQVRVNEVVIEGAVAGDPSVLGVVTGLAVRQ
jgi:hypothetical protein